MAKNSVGDWDTIAANNTDVGGISIAEGMSPGNVNNALREIMAQVKSNQITDLAVADGGTGASNAADARDNLGIVHIPIGGIILWSGSIGSIPTNFALCDGTNGTPDLRDRFVVGAGSGYAVGATGGANTVTLTESQMPAHTHGDGSLATNTAGSHSHSDTFSVNTTSLTGSFATRQSEDNEDMITNQSGVFSYGGTGSGLRRWAKETIDRDRVITNFDGTHNHSLSGGINSSGTHSHDITGDTGSVGGGNAHENRPPYYALAYIMRIT